MVMLGWILTLRGAGRDGMRSGRVNEESMDLPNHSEDENITIVALLCEP